MANPHGAQPEEEEEEDYMSEAFLNNLVSQAEKNTKKSGVSLTYSERRREKEKKHLANLPKPLHVREKEAREQGLKRELGEENKGMAMLLKMGFKKGGTLGASQGSGTFSPATSFSATSSSSPPPSELSTTALRAPLEIQIKQGRGGLGMESSKKRQLEEELQKQESEVNRVFDEGYRGKKGSQFDQEKRKRQLLAAQGICMRMDSDRALAIKAIEADLKEQSTLAPTDEPAESQRSRSNEFWWIADFVSDDILGTRAMGPGQVPELLEDSPNAESSRPFDHSDDEDGDPEDKRIKKRVKIASDSEITIGLEGDDVTEPAKWGERPDFAELEVHEKLERVVAYLRKEFFYCFWCSARYDGKEDLDKFCPGEAEDDH
ncbi:hypothetical protein EMPS_06058 [Entomortierella parvispora]|uniref:G-patch domain-containing protein n=1 Tax=Entomortierella parvispora TaxID=205924 RepID=A0A9P3HBX2_9FUNG|nr:hypothetical protein EMPS_06058 [Entomortierella parvispora]